MHPEKTSLSIRLTEPVVPLRNIPLAEHEDDDMMPPAAVVRGLLALNLAKPTKVSSIELELEAKATTRYARGAGPSHIDVTEQYQAHSASTVVFKAGPAPHALQRATSARNKLGVFPDLHTGSAVQEGTRLSGVDSGYWQAPSEPRPDFRRSASFDPRFLRIRQQPKPPPPSPSPSPSPPQLQLPPPPPPPPPQQLSSGDLEIDDFSNPQGIRITIDPAPPYPSQSEQHPFPGGDSENHRSMAGGSVASGAGVMGLVLPGSLAPSQGSLTPAYSPCPSPTSSEHSTCYFSPLHSPNIEIVPEDETESVGTCTPNPDDIDVATDSSSCSSKQDHRGRSHSQFSLGSIVDVLDAVKDRARSWSPRTGPRSRSAEPDDNRRPWTKGKGKAQVGAHGVLPQFGHVEPSVADGVNGHRGDGWVVFPEGTYTYPIYFTIPNNSPPTVNVNHGSLIWRVKAEVKRPGTFKSKMTAQKEVTVVSLRKDDGSDEIEGIDLSQQWEDQLQYHVQVTGRAFPVGGKMPFQLTIMPLTKIKVHCISVFLDERTEYYARAESRPRQDAMRRTTLLVIRQNSTSERYTEPILPLISKEPEVFHKSPLYRFLNPGENESEVASSYMGQGPWTIRHQLKVPDSCSILHPSNQIKGSNVMVNHKLKVTLTVEREDGTETIGKKKLYDIIVHIPIQILSGRCTSEWASLPRYNEAVRSGGDSLEDDISIRSCRTRPQATAPTYSHAVDTLERTASLLTPNWSPSRGLDMLPSDSLTSPSHLHERLMAGLVDERGETPPSYAPPQAICV